MGRKIRNEYTMYEQEEHSRTHICISCVASFPTNTHTLTHLTLNLINCIEFILLNVVILCIFVFESKWKCCFSSFSNILML